MQLKKLQALIEDYAVFLKTDQARSYLYLWECEQFFRSNWDMAALDWRQMYDNSFQSTITRRLWFRENYEPKRMLLLFLKMQPDYVKSMFQDLFDESKRIDGRVQRFLFYCDELLAQYRAEHPASIENNHFHDDQYQMISVYLAFRYPQQYTIYNHSQFVKLLESVGSKDIPPAADFERFAKVSRTLSTFLRKNETVVARHKNRLKDFDEEAMDSMLLVHDFYQFI